MIKAASPNPWMWESHRTPCMETNTINNSLSRIAVPHSSVGSVQDLRAGGRWFDSRLGLAKFSPRIDDSPCYRIYSSLPAVYSFDNGYLGKQPVVLERILFRVLIKRTPEQHG